MKRLGMALVLLLGLTFVGFKTLSDHSGAKADQMQGLYVFVNSTPTSEYQYLGTVETAGRATVKELQYSEVRDKLIKIAKEEYPNADGLIFHFQTGARDKVDAIKFKD